MAVDVPEVEEVRKLLEELNEKALVARLDSFLRLNEGLESKKGKDFIEVSVLGFLEGVLTVLRAKYPGKEKVEALYVRVKSRREELDEQFRKPGIPLEEE
ncbi:DUF3216 domain-containing protein [Thermococcus waiotapuensis]|uniref:DUF3216 domain-containing protein n=1 Tax=Thermococcus waiotapuensis TaxID=90909 RepID=A0AAE4T323_9EURY|nr:DUF3216 domain-containing protein [Thermococcus waiotapuensis]MDV3103296.1 DUF3216 domain-containing protein [Thermococcus waiotapuensis]